MEKSNPLITTISFLILLFLILSCSKENIEKCSANCANVIFSGKIWDSSNRKGLADLPVRVYWKDAGFCIICPQDEIARSKTDAQGNFYLNLSVDSSRFHGNRLYVEVPIPGDYIANNSHNGVLATSLGQYIPLVQNIKFTMYQAANLNIKLQRTQTDNFISFELSYLFDFTTGGIYWHSGGPPLPHTEFTRVAGANVFTKVSWRKGYGPGMTSTFTDSIKCTVTGPNAIILDY